MVGPKHVTRKGRGRGSDGLVRLRHEFHRFREEVGCIRSLPSLHRRWPCLGRLEIDSKSSSEDGTLWGSEELPRGIFSPETADGEIDGIDKGVPIHNLEEFPDLGFESSCNTQGLNQENAIVQTTPFDESLAKCADDCETEKSAIQFKREDLCDIKQKQPAPNLDGLKPDWNLDAIEHFREGFDPVKPISSCEDSASSQNIAETGHNTAESPALPLGNQEEEKNCLSELSDGLGKVEYAAYVEKVVENAGNTGLHPAESGGRSLGNYTDLRSVDACSDEEFVDNTLSHSGARISAAAYFTANPHHKHDEIPPVSHRHIKCQNEGSTQVDILNISNNESRKEAEFCNLQELTDDEKDTKTDGNQVNGSSVQLLQPISLKDFKGPLNLVGYVYEEVPTKIAAQIPDQMIPNRTSSFPISKAVESLPMESGNKIVHASMNPGALDARRQHHLTEAEERTNVNDLTTAHFQRNTPMTASSECDIHGKAVKREGGGISSLIGLTSLESLTRLGDVYKRDSRLAATMARRIKHALESLGEPSMVNDRCMKGFATKVTDHKPRLGKGGFAGYRAPSGIGSSKVGKKLRFKTESHHPKPKIISDDRHRSSNRWVSSDASGPAARSSDTVRPEEPETYLQHVIAALDSGNDSDVQEESDTQQDLSSSSDEAPEKQDNCLHEHPREQSISPQGHTEEGAKVCSLKPCTVAHDHRCRHGRSSPLHGTGSSSFPLHTLVRPCCFRGVHEELPVQRHLNSGCSGSPTNSCVSRSPRVVRNSAENDRPIDGTDFTDPQSFSVKVNGSIVEIEVGEKPPSIIWTPRGQSEKSVAVRTPLYETQEQNTSGGATTESYAAAKSVSGNPNSLQVRELTDLTDPGRRQTNEDPRVVRFRDPVPPGKVSKSVRFHSEAKDSCQDKFYSREQIHERFEKTAKSLARKAQGLGGIEATGEAVGGSQQSPRQMQGRVQGEETSRSILRSSRGASESDSQVQEHPRRGREATQVTDGTGHSGTAVAGPREIKVRTAKRRSILKTSTKKASLYSEHDCRNGVIRDEDDASDIDARKEKHEAAAASLADELQILMRSRTPEYFKDQEERHDDGSSASEESAYRQRLRIHRPKKVSGHSGPRKQESPEILKEFPGHCQSLYHSTHSPHTATPSNRLTGQFRSNYQVGSSNLSSENQKEPSGRVPKTRQLQSLSENGISVLTAGEGRDRLAYREAQSRWQRLNSASTRPAKQIVKDTLGDTFDYDQFQQESD